MRTGWWRRGAVLGGVFVLAVWRFAVPVGAVPVAATIEVGIVEREVDAATWGFDPPDATAAAGDTVRWTNRGRIDHNIYIPDSGFSSDIMHTGDTTEYRFPAAGVYKYVCGLHPTMAGTVTIGP